MPSLFGSKHGLAALAALEQAPEGLTLTETARHVGISVSSAQAALGGLIADGFVERGSGRPTRYRFTHRGREAAARILDLVARRHRDALLPVTVRSNQAVEFAGLDDGGLLLVVRWDARPADESALLRMLDRLGTNFTRLDHDDVREQLLDDGELIKRVRGTNVLVGSVARSFPDPFGRGDPHARRLHALHPDLTHPSQRALATIARSHGLSEIRVFGSAVHADFRPDSDVDVMVRRKAGVTRTLEDDLALRRELESLVGRNIDVLDADVLRAQVRRRAEEEGVVVYG